MAASRSEVARYHRDAAVLSTAHLLHPSEKAAKLDALPRMKRKKLAPPIEAEWAKVEAAAADEAVGRLAVLREAAAALSGALGDLAALGRPELLGKAETELTRVRTALAHL